MVIFWKCGLAIDIYIFCKNLNDKMNYCSSNQKCIGSSP